MDWKDVGKKVAEFAPAIGTVLGGPAAAIGGAVGLLAKAFGLTEDATPDQLDRAINADPDAILKLRALDIEVERMYLVDRQGARQADIEKTKATGRRDWAMYGLAGLITAGFFSLTALLCFRTLPEGSSQAVFMLFGNLGTAFGAVVGYFFGSSKSSSDKTQLLANKKE